VLGDLNLIRQIIRNTLAPADYEISADCNRDGIKLRRCMSPPLAVATLRDNAALRSLSERSGH